MNFSKLGIVSREYVENMYGQTDSPLHQGRGDGPAWWPSGPWTRKGWSHGWSERWRRIGAEGSVRGVAGVLSRSDSG